MPTPEEEAAAKAAEETKAKDDAAKAQGKTFTQAELDAIIKERLDRATEKASKEREAEKLRIEQETAAKNGEWQKVAEAREKESAQAKADAEIARAELREERTKNATLAAANRAEYGADGKSKFRNAELAYKLAKLDNPTLAAETVPDALKAIAKAYPEMLEGAQAQQQQNNPGPSKGQRPTTQTPSSTAQPVYHTKY